MTYGSTSDATDFRPPDWRDRLIAGALFFIPKANPDHHRLYPQVKKWILELNEDGAAVREIGIDKDGEPILRAPNPRNLGFWTDSDRNFSEAEITPISQSEFEHLWNAAVPPAPA